LTRSGEGIPRGLRAIVDKCLQRSPGARYQSMTELADGRYVVLSGNTIRDSTYQAVLLSYNADAGNITGSAQVRETFTPKADVSVSSVGLYLWRTSGSGPLTFSLENSDGSLIDTASASSSQLTAGDYSKADWASAA